MIRSRGIVAIAGLLVALMTTVASACPFCLGSQQLTLRERIETPDASLLVEWESGEPGNFETGVPATTTFEVLKVWRGRTAADQPLTIDRYQEGRPGDRFLLIGNTLDDVIRWDRAIPLSDEALAYIRGLPSSETSMSERLKHAFEHLESTDTTIANDSFAVVGNAKYEDIAAAKNHLNPDRLRQWVHDPQTTVMRLGVYGMLLGLAGSEQDVSRLRERILATDPEQPIRLGIDGVMGGYLLLTGAEGLETLDEAFLKSPEVSDGDLNAVVPALRFIWEYGDGVISKDRLRRSMRLALDHEATQEMAIRDLARWQDWTMTDSLIELYNETTDNDYLRRAIIGFLIVASEADAETLDDADRAAAQHAAKALKVIQDESPGQYQRAAKGIVRQ